LVFCIESYWKFLNFRQPPVTTKKDTVIYNDTGISGNHRVTVIRKDGEDTFRSSFYLYSRNKEFRPGMQIQYNSQFEILGVKFYKSTDYIQ